jgi:hypothetical protein
MLLIFKYIYYYILFFMVFFHIGMRFSNLFTFEFLNYKSYRQSHLSGLLLAFIFFIFIC